MSRWRDKKYIFPESNTLAFVLHFPVKYLAFPASSSRVTGGNVTESFKNKLKPPVVADESSSPCGLVVSVSLTGQR